MSEKDIVGLRVESYLGEHGERAYHPDDVVIVLEHEGQPPTKIVLAGEILYPGDEENPEPLKIAISYDLLERLAAHLGYTLQKHGW